MFSLKMIVESPGDTVAVEGIAQAEDHASQGEALFFTQRKGDGLQLLNERIASVVLRMIVMLAIGGGLAWLACYPLPDLHGLVRIDKDDEVLVGGFGQLAYRSCGGSHSRECCLRHRAGTGRSARRAFRQWR